MKSLMIAGALLAGMSSYALADGHGSRWDGIYIGGHVGLASVDTSGVFDNVVAPDPLQLGELDLDGVAFGGQLGFNHKVFDSIVIGVEVDASFMNEKETAESPAGEQSANFEIEAFGSARVRAGVDLGDFMPFATAGVGLVDYTLNLDDVNDIPGSASFDETVFAPVLGGGVEWLIADNLMLRAEGLIYLVDHEECLSGGDGGSPVCVPALGDGDPGDNFGVDGLYTVRGGVSYKF